MILAIMLIPLVKEISTSSVHYHQSNATLAMQKDGQQTLMISLLAGMRLSLLSTQLTTIIPRLPNLPIEILTVSIGMIPSLIQPLARGYLTRYADATFIGALCIKKICQLIAKSEEIGVGKGINYVLQHADIVVNTACLVSYIAFISLGFYTSGIIGLSGLFLLGLKRYGYLPSLVDQNLSTVSKILFVTSSFFIQTSIITKTLIIILSVYTCLDLVLKCSLLNKYAPEAIKNPLSGEHKRNELKNYNLIDSNCRVSINRSHIYTDNLSVDSFTQGTERSIADLFSLFEERLEKEQILLTPEERDGLQKLKNGAILGRVEDQLPLDFPKFQKLISLLIQAILGNESFQSYSKEFASIGNSCTEGWMNMTTALLSPKNDANVEAAVHYVLAKQRGAFLNEQFQEFATKLKRMDSPIDFGVIGGNNNIHFINNIHAGLWHHFRTMEGELYLQTNPSSLLGKITIRYLLSKNASDVLNSTPKLILDRFHLVNQMTIFHPVLAGALGALLELSLNSIKKYFTNPDRLTNCIYDAISDRTISWDNAVSSWLSKMNEKIAILDETDEENGCYNRRWVEKNEKGLYTLTKDGVRLLLWDLDILILTPSFFSR